MRLTELEPEFLKLTGDPRTYRRDATFADCDGLWFLCPLCWLVNGGRKGTHGIICWKPHVPQSFPPIPGRWSQAGSGFNDLSLVAGSSSIALGGGCQWHGFVQNGEVHTGLGADDIARARAYRDQWKRPGGHMADETAAPAPVVDEWAGFQPTARLRFRKAEDGKTLLEQRWDHHEGAQRWAVVPLFEVPLPEPLLPIEADLQP